MLDKVSYRDVNRHGEFRQKLWRSGAGRISATGFLTRRVEVEILRRVELVSLKDQISPKWQKFSYFLEYFRISGFLYMLNHIFNSIFEISIGGEPAKEKKGWHFMIFQIEKTDWI